MESHLSPEQLRDRYTEIANRLAQWINEAPLPPVDLVPVYDGHVLLCELIRGLAKPPTEDTPGRPSPSARTVAVEAFVPASAYCRDDDCGMLLPCARHPDQMRGDEDVPDDVKRTLMRAATAKSISYYWLVDVYLGNVRPSPSSGGQDV